MKIYHRQAANLNDFDQKVEFMFGKKNNYHQIGNAFLQYELKIEKVVAVAADRILVDVDVIKLVNNAFADCFKEACLSTTGGCDIKYRKHAGQVSTVIRALTDKFGDLLSHFDKTDGSEAETENTTLKQLLIINHNVAANRIKVKLNVNYH